MKRIGETLGEEDWRGGGAGGGQEEEEEEEEEQTALIKSNKPHLAGGEFINLAQNADVTSLLTL